LQDFSLKKLKEMTNKQLRELKENSADELKNRKITIMVHQADKTFTLKEYLERVNHGME
jgi:hypothetical protein